MFRILIVLILVGSVLAPDTVRADMLADCKQSADTKRRIDGCRKAIRTKAVKGAELAMAHVRLGRAYDRKGDHNRAVWHFSAALKIDKKLTTAFRGRGIAWLSLRSNSRAAKDFTRALELEPDDAGTMVNRGLAYYRGGNLKKAMKDYNQAIRLKPDNANAYHNRGLAARRQKNLVGAIRDFTKVIELKPKSASAYDQRGTTRYRQKKYDLAVKDLTRAIELNPKRSGAHNNRGRAYHMQRKYALAVKDFDRALRLRPGNKRTTRNRGDAFNGLAWDAYKAGKLELALAHADSSLRDRHDGAAAYDTRAHVLAALGRIDDAMADFERAIKLDGSVRVAKYQRALKDAGHWPDKIDAKLTDAFRKALRACLTAGCRLLG